VCACVRAYVCVNVCVNVFVCVNVCVNVCVRVEGPFCVMCMCSMTHTVQLEKRWFVGRRVCVTHTVPINSGALYDHRVKLDFRLKLGSDGI